MGMRQFVDRTLRQRLYSGPLKQIIVWTGIHSTLRTLYWTVMLRLFGGEQTITVGDATATVMLTERGELHRFSKGLEEEVIERLLAEVQPDDVFYDIGANIGMFIRLVGDALS
jgi:hypothetical protein